MGASFCAVFEGDVPPHGTIGGDNPALLRHQRRLDRLARQNGLTPLSAFESYDPADLADLLGEDDAAEAPPAQWFAPADGLAAVRALAAYLNAQPGTVTDQANVLADLASIEEELTAAERAGARFRFAVGP
jgi:hypothetical protein